MAKWEKGQSGNAGGRPRQERSLRKLAQSNTKEALLTLRQIMIDKNAQDKDRIFAANSILDRGYGKPAQTTEISGPEGAPLAVESVNILDLGRRIAFLLHGAALELPKAGEMSNEGMRNNFLNGEDI